MKQIIVISSPEPYLREQVWINKMFDAGLERFHLRKPGCLSVDLCRLLNKIDKTYHDRIALHQHHELADDYGIRSLHFPERERSRFSFDKRKCYSTSVHSTGTYRELPPVFSYTFFGPVFDSISKKWYRQKIDLAEAAKVKKEIQMIALGGIHAANCEVPIRHGFDGIAVLGAVWENTDPLSAFKQIHTCITTGL